MGHVAEFDCTDCGAHVVSLAPPHNPARRCAACQWLAEIPVASLPWVQRDELRQHLEKLGIIGTGDTTLPPAPSAHVDPDWQAAQDADAVNAVPGEPV